MITIQQVKQHLKEGKTVYVFFVMKHTYTIQPHEGKLFISEPHNPDTKEVITMTKLLSVLRKGQFFDYELI